MTVMSSQMDSTCSMLLFAISQEIEHRIELHFERIEPAIHGIKTVIDSSHFHLQISKGLLNAIDPLDEHAELILRDEGLLQLLDILIGNHYGQYTKPALSAWNLGTRGSTLG